MQIGIVIDGKKIRNEDIDRAKIPLPYVGLRRYFYPDPDRQKYYRNKILTVTEFIKYLSVSHANLRLNIGCVQQAYFDYYNELYIHPASLMSLVQGKMLHEGLSPELPSTDKEFEIEADIDTKYGRVPVAGTIDFYNDEYGIIYEVKTARTLYNIPKLEHITQGCIYYYLVKQNRMKANKLELIYLSHAHYALFTYGRNKIEDILSSMRLRHEPLKPAKGMSASEVVGETLSYNEKADVWEVKPAYWRCAYCMHRRYCSHSRENMRDYLSSFRFLRRDGDVNVYAVRKFITSVKPAGVKEQDRFVMPEIELRDLLVEFLGDKYDDFVSICEYERKRTPTPFAPEFYTWW